MKDPYFDPGAGWHYSNTNYVLLGQVVERVAGRSWAAELRARFFDPLRLTSAFVQGVERPKTSVSHGYRFTSASKSASSPDRAPIFSASV